MGKIMAVANQKGGVGKTTTAINLASCLAAAEKKTLLIDIDPQANSSSGLGYFSKEDAPTIYEVIINKIPAHQAIRATALPYLNLLPSHMRLAGAEVELVPMVAREHILKEATRGLKEEYDYIIIDCPPSLGLLTLNTLTAADSVLIPIQCEYYALEGMGQLLNSITLVQRHLNPDLAIEGVLLTMFDMRLNLSRQVADETRKFFPDKVYSTTISRNVRLSEAPSFGKPIILYDILSTGAQNYISLAKEVMGHG